MARPPRLDLPDVPQHIVQRGNNRGTCFFEDSHRLLYKALLREAAALADVSIHAYVLMDNHSHVLATPRRAGGVSAMIQALGRRYVPSINKDRQRSGTLFQGRFGANPVHSERYLLCCYRYIELNPVRAAMVASPEAYRWSSYRCNALGQPDDLVAPHPVFMALGDTVAQRQALYRAFVAEGVPGDERQAIRDHLRQGRALGSSDFQALVSTASGRPAKLVPRGRPRKKKGSDPFS